MEQFFGHFLLQGTDAVPEVNVVLPVVKKLIFSSEVK